MSSPSKSMNGCPLPSASSANTPSISCLFSAAPTARSVPEASGLTSTLRPMAVPDWLDPLYDAPQQRALDDWAINELGTPGAELMERAGAGLAELVQRLAPTG